MTDEIQKKISENYNAMTELQLDKNKKYGNAALEPLGVFFRGEHIKDVKQPGFAAVLMTNW